VRFRQHSPPTQSLSTGASQVAALLHRKTESNNRQGPLKRSRKDNACRHDYCYWSVRMWWVCRNRARHYHSGKWRSSLYCRQWRFLSRLRPECVSRYCTLHNNRRYRALRRGVGFGNDTNNSLCNFADFIDLLSHGHRSRHSLVLELGMAMNSPIFLKSPCPNENQVPPARPEKNQNAARPHARDHAGLS